MRFKLISRSRLLTSACKIGWVPMCLVLMACHLDMYNQPRAQTYEYTPFYDGSSARPIPANTVSRGRPGTTPLETGRDADGEFLTSNALANTDQEALLARGADQYQVFCAPCHGALANGRGPVSSLFAGTDRDNPRALPPSFYIDRLREAPDGYLFDVITHGYGNMYGYASRVAPEDRWAIIAYIRSLQATPPEGAIPTALPEGTPSPTPGLRSTETPTPAGGSSATALPTTPTATAAQ